MKTARFATLVAKAGKPDHHLAWSDPGRDRTLAKAAKQHRLLSIHQQMRGGKTDFGAVGLEEGKATQYYIFPRSVKGFEGRRIVAINYDLAGEKTTSGEPHRTPKRALKNDAKARRARQSIPAKAEEKSKLDPPAVPHRPKRLNRAQIRSRLFTALDKLEAADYSAVQARLTELLEGVRD